MCIRDSLSKSTMTNEFSKTYPERFFNMGIAEQNLYGTAAGPVSYTHLDVYKRQP